MCEELVISALTGKKYKDYDGISIKKHFLFWNHTPNFENFTILTNNINDFQMTSIESLLINRDDSPLNKNKESLP